MPLRTGARGILTAGVFESLDSSMAVDDSACRSPFTNQMPRGCGFARESALVQGQAVILRSDVRAWTYQRIILASVPARLSFLQSCSYISLQRGNVGRLAAAATAVCMHA